jgi:ACT domain-containing protein
MTLHETIKAINANGGTTYEIDVVVHNWDYEFSDDMLLQAVCNEAMRNVLKSLKIVN